MTPSLPLPLPNYTSRNDPLRNEWRSTSYPLSSRQGILAFESGFCPRDLEASSARLSSFMGPTLSHLFFADDLMLSNLRQARGEVLGQVSSLARRWSYRSPRACCGTPLPFDSMGKGLLYGEVQGRFTKKRPFGAYSFRLWHREGISLKQCNRLPWDGLRGIFRNSPEQPFDSLALIRALGTDS
ncbi:hypothetical protein COLO4_04086 [Corchorus olitorius]|uniref:Uncharacterized protein n=1 Tax=Corchorus olitorius TaxID=93759 RepID=A0A1R3KV91_9ROSI|nr:hypothetical protein COLO4_04086 [Corchorus olitorius]